MDEPKSRTEKKREAALLEDLARELSGLGAAAIAALPVDPALLNEIRETARVRQHGARKRQVKFLAKTLRHADPDLVQRLMDVLSDRHRSHLSESKRHRELEKLRDRLLDPACSDDALAEVEERFPGADLDGIRSLVNRSAERYLPKYSREIFRRLRTASEQTIRQ